MNIKAVVVAAFATLIPLVSAGSASAVTFTLVNVGCSTEDCSMTGTFDYNGAFSNINITMTGAVFPGSVFSSDQGSTAAQLLADDNNNNYLELNFASPLPAGGGTDTVSSGCLFTTAGAPNFDCGLFFRTFGFSGTVQAAVSASPVPAALPLFASGLGALGMLGWRKKRKQTAA